MTVIFPKNNLPEPTQPWAREIQKQLANVLASDAANEVNNAARDNQLNSSLITLRQTVSSVKIAADQANDAIDGLTALASNNSDYTISADNIISGGVRDGVLTLSSGSNSYVSLFNGGVDIFGPGDSGIRVGNSGNGGTQIQGSLSLLGGNIRAPGITATQFLQAENHQGGGTTTASINNNGTITRTSSSERYKQDIENLSVDYHELLSLKPKRFKLKEEALENPDARYYAGFIAEDIDKTSLKDFVAYKKMENGSVVPDGVYYGELTAALLQAIKHQDTLISALTERISVLENDKVE